MDELNQIFNSSLKTGFIDKSVLSNLAYQPELLVNQKNPPKKILSSIINELSNCNQFFISVAFAFAFYRQRLVSWLTCLFVYFIYWPQLAYLFSSHI